MSWKEQLPEILEGYASKGIWNMDETACLWRALPEKGLGKACHRWKKSKLIVTVAFFVNAAGNKEKPIVVWKPSNLHCFKHINKAPLTVNCFNESNALMSCEIMHTIVEKLNSSLKRESRSIILLMDNTSYPQD